MWNLRNYLRAQDEQHLQIYQTHGCSVAVLSVMALKQLSLLLPISSMVSPYTFATGQGINNPRESIGKPTRFSRRPASCFG